MLIQPGDQLDAWSRVPLAVTGRRPPDVRFHRPVLGAPLSGTHVLITTTRHPWLVVTLTQESRSIPGKRVRVAVTRQSARDERDPPPSKPTRRPWAIAAAAWNRHRDLLSNTATLVATTGTTAVLGFAFWTVAARLFSQQAVGYAAAALSAMTLLGTVGVLGLGTLLIGELPRRGGSRVGLIAAALVASGLGSLTLGVVFVIVAPHLSSHFSDVDQSTGRAAVFCLGVVLTAMTQVFDQATIGLLRGGLQLSRNFSFAIMKIVALVGVSLFLHSALGTGIILSWIICNGLSLLPIGVQLWFKRELPLPKPDWRTLFSLGRAVVAHNWLNLSIQVPAALMTVIAASIVSPSDNAGFYAAWTIANVLYVLPLHLSTVLFAVASADPQVIARKLRFALLLSFALGLPAMAVLGVGAHLILTFFGPGYAQVATVPMLLLVVAYLPGIPKLFYVAVCRALGKISRAAAVLTTFAGLEVAAAIAGGLKDGLIGLSFGLLAVATVEALVTAPAVIRAALGTGKHRRQSAGTSAGVRDTSSQKLAANASWPGSGLRTYPQAQSRSQQLAALELLMAMASTSTVADLQVPSAPGLRREHSPTGRRKTSTAGGVPPDC